MKKLVFFLFLGCFLSLSLAANSATIKKIEAQKKTDLILKEGQNSIKIKIQDSKTIDNFIQKANEQVSLQNRDLIICFVYITDITFEEAMDGTLYAILDLTINCYGDPSAPPLIIVIDQTQ
jgi:hypothetical protein